MEQFQQNDFQIFEPRLYLNEYFRYAPDEFGGMGMENEQFLSFFAKVAHENNFTNTTLLDFGCGPTIYSIISMARDCAEIHMSDYLPNNLQQIQWWLEENPEAFDWTPYLRRALELEATWSNQTNIQVSSEMIDKRAAILRTKISRLIPGNAKVVPPLGVEGFNHYDVIITSFCLEGVATTVEEWQNLMANLSTKLKPGGLLVFQIQVDSSSYRVGEQYFSVVNLSESIIKQTLIDGGYLQDTIQYHYIKGITTHPEYDRFLAGTARKQ